MAQKILKNTLGDYWTLERQDKLKKLFTYYNGPDTNCDMFWDELEAMIINGEF